VPEKIAAHTGREGYDAFLGELAAGPDGPQVKWAVEAWATGLGRPPGYVAPPVKAGVVEPPPGFDRPAVADATVRRIMAGIAAAGGFLGGLLGNGGLLLVFLLADVTVDVKYSGQSVEQGKVVLALVLAALMATGGVSGGAGAFAGWMYGRGDERPWAGFAASCGAAFGTGCLLFCLVGPGLITAMAMACSTFGAAFAAASRSGQRV
jgi:hypothetical protein